MNEVEAILFFFGLACTAAYIGSAIEKAADKIIKALKEPRERKPTERHEAVTMPAKSPPRQRGNGGEMRTVKMEKGFLLCEDCGKPTKVKPTAEALQALKHGSLICGSDCPGKPKKEQHP